MITVRFYAYVVGAVILVVIGLVFGLGGGATTAQASPVGGCSVQAGSPGPGNSGSGGVTQKSATLTGAQMAVARVIAQTGKSMSITQRGVAIALATAMQESTLNPNAVNGRSVGLFQQQGDLYAGVDRTDPASSTQAFYQLLVARVPNYDSPSEDMAAAAQAVQASGAGASKYAQWESWATALAAQLYSGAPGTGGGTSVPTTEPVTCTPGGGSGPIAVVLNGLAVTLPAKAGIQGTVTAPNPAAATAIAAALSYLGTEYVWGGGGPNGPTTGQPGDPADPTWATTVGFDCSGLMVYAFAQAGIALPHSSAGQLSGARTTVPFSSAQPGDLLFWGNPVHHVAMFLGQINGAPYLVQAPDSGSVVQVAKVDTGGDFRGVAARPAG